MEKSKVFFVPVNDAEDPKSINAKLKTLIERVNPFRNIKKDSLVAVKLHFGEEENAGYVNPLYVATIVEELKKKESRVFLTDTNALYKGSRTNSVDHLNLAFRHGFSPDKVKAPIIIADGVKGDDYRELKVKRDFVKKAFIASAICRADALVVISHFKGHIMAGFGGAIKNLGMGCASRRGKLVQHGGVAPFINEEKCNACGTCIETCPVAAIKFVSKKAKINPEICIGCASCIAVCPVGAIDVSWAKGADTIQEKMAEYALAAVSDKKDNCVFFNFAIKITKECDCLAKDDPKISPDIGIFASFDAVSIDQACVDKLNQISAKDILRQQHPDCDWRKQLIHAQKVGLGNREYELTEIK